MIKLRPSKERGHADHGWLDTYHTFSFAGYFDPQHMGFGPLRVINEDRVAPGAGFGTHPHDNMEILTWVLSGALEHKDSMGNGEAIRPGEMQAMTAGTGITHSEFNPSQSESVHLLQIWIKPARRNLKPSYDQRAFKPEELAGRLALLASSDARDGSLKINQDADVYAARVETGTTLTHTLRPDRKAWLQVVRGAVELNGKPLQAGDGAAMTEEERLELKAREASEVLLFDMA